MCVCYHPLPSYFHMPTMQCSFPQCNVVFPFSEHSLAAHILISRADATERMQGLQTFCPSDDEATAKLEKIRLLKNELIIKSPHRAEELNTQYDALVKFAEETFVSTNCCDRHDKWLSEKEYASWCKQQEIKRALKGSPSVFHENILERFLEAPADV